MSSFSRLTLGLAAAFLLAAGAGASAAELVPHRAAYQLGKGASKAGQAVAQVGGAMTIEIDESCDGWSLSQRIRMDVTDSMGTDLDSDSRYASFETKDGTLLRFQASDWQDGNLVEETAGTAERPAPDKPGTAQFVKPERQSFDLPPGALFPVAFNIELLKRLEKGEPYASMRGFDGGNLEGAYTITVFIGKERESEWRPDTRKGEAAKDDRGKLVGGKVRNVRVAYFPLASQAPEPELEYEMELQPNGVSPVMRLDYQRYQVIARLVEIKAMPRPACNR
ncbi:MAG: EipB family protein [Rhodospirillales bacterium]